MAIWSDFLNDMETSIKNTIIQCAKDIISGTLAKPTTEAKFAKIRITKKNDIFFVEKFTEKQAFQNNINIEELQQYLIENIAINYKHVYLETQNQSITFLTNKKGKTTILTKNLNQKFKPVTENTNTSVNLKNTNNRAKKYILTDGEPIPFLIHLGIMNAQGTVLAQKYDKFKQINRFLEYIRDILDNLVDLNNIQKDDKPLRVIDFGCGKSYLTFAVYHYLHNILGINVEITGLDLKDDVITMCSLLAKEFGYDSLNFYSGTIEEYFATTKDKNCDLVITLHACDTATDYALASAIKQNTKVILSVPCCQHELNTNFNGKHTPDGISEMLKHGIIRERFLSLATDVMRCELLEQNNYDVQLLEFIDISHTPKNLMIRAVKKDKPTQAKEGYSHLAKMLEEDITLASLLNSNIY